MSLRMLNRPELPGRTKNNGVNVYSSSLPSFHVLSSNNNPDRRLRRPLSSPSNITIDKTYKIEFDGTTNLPSTTVNEPILTHETINNESKDRYTHKLLNTLPHNIRENVLSLLSSSQSTAARLQREIETRNVENAKLRNELSKKINETDQAQKLAGIYRDKVRMADDKITILTETVESNQKSIVRNRRVMDRLSSTNRTLIETLDAIQLTNDSNQGNNQSMNHVSSRFQTPSNHPYGGPMSPLRLKHQRSNDFDIPSPKKGVVSGIIATGLIGESPKGLNIVEPKLVQKKLRESLLKVVRVHYQSMKNTDVLETKLEQLKSKLKQSEIELIEHRRRYEAEICGDYVDVSPSRRTTSSTINGGNEMPHQTNTRAVGNIIQSLPSQSSRKYYRSYGEADDKFQSLLTSNHLDMSDTVLQLRRLMAYMADMVTHTSTIDELCSLCTSHVVAKILDVEFISLFMRPTLSQATDDREREGNSNGHILHKYTCRSRRPELININESQSLASQVMLIKKNARLNSLSRVLSYNADVDCAPGVQAKRLISIPMRDMRDQHVDSNTTNMLTAIENADHESDPIIFGTIHFINKSSVITESDEIILTTFTDFISSLLLNCKYMHDIFEKSQLLGHLLESSTAVYDVIPDHHNIAFAPSRLIIQPKEILHVIERIFYTILKVSKVRALLVTNQINQDSDMLSDSLTHSLNHFLYLDPYYKKTMKQDSQPNSAGLIYAGLHSGIAGHVYRTKDFHTFDFSSTKCHDERLNPLIDIEPLIGGYLICLPVVSLSGNILAVIELIHGIHSPSIRGRGSDANPSYASDQIDFLQASLWLVHQLTPPLEYLMAHVNKSVTRPAMSPGSISNSAMPSPRLQLGLPSLASSAATPISSSVSKFKRSNSFSTMKSTTLVSQRRGSKQLLGGSITAQSPDGPLVRQPSTTDAYVNHECESPDRPSAGYDVLSPSIKIETVMESMSIRDDTSLIEPTRLFSTKNSVDHALKDENTLLKIECDTLRDDNKALQEEIEALRTAIDDKLHKKSEKTVEAKYDTYSMIFPSEPAPRITRPVSSHR